MIFRVRGTRTESFRVDVEAGNAAHAEALVLSGQVEIPRDENAEVTVEYVDLESNLP